MCGDCNFPLENNEFYYPQNICNECAMKNKGKIVNIAATWHIGMCGWCKRHKRVLAPRDFGYPEYRPKK